jgi:adenylate cyclase
MDAPTPSDRAARQVKPQSEPARSRRVLEAIAREERAGQTLAARTRIVVLGVAGVLLAFVESPPELYYFEGVILTLGVLGVAQYRLAIAGRRWLGFVFGAIDAVVIVLAIVFVSVLLRGEGSPQMALRDAPVGYLFLFMAYVAISYSPALMLLAGVSAALAWAMAIVWMVLQPGTVLRDSGDASASGGALDAAYVDLSMHVEEFVLLLLCAVILAFVVRRSHALVMREAGAARERANLARYFSPTVVDELAGRDEPLGPVRRQEVAVLFADIVGFTTLAEASPPEDVMSMLREFHSRMEAEVFAHRGTLEKFIGDALLATFGVPAAGGHEGSNALSCAYAMQASMRPWNEQRRARGEPPLRLGIGAHFGPVVMGDIGSARNVAFAVVGDTVNTASRLQALTRTLDCDIIVSDALVAAARSEGAAARALLERLTDAGPQLLRGRGEPVRVWCAHSESADDTPAQAFAAAAGDTGT